LSPDTVDGDNGGDNGDDVVTTFLIGCHPQKPLSTGGNYGFAKSGDNGDNLFSLFLQ